MDKALYIAMTGAKNNMMAQRSHANNLANINTNGFRKDFAQARAMPVYGEHFPSRAYAMTERPKTDFSQGSMIQTGRSLDVAVKGEGWLAVESAPGEEAYTRYGHLYIGNDGTLRTGQGFAVVGGGGPINIPPADKVEFGADGSISIVPAGAGPEELVLIDRIKLVKPDENTLSKGEDGLIRAENPDDVFLDPSVRLESGFLEASNVNVVETFTDYLSLARQYDLQVKVMKSAEENDEVSARLLQLS